MPGMVGGNRDRGRGVMPRGEREQRDVGGGLGVGRVTHDCDWDYDWDV